MMLRFGETAFEELVGIDDPEELCRRWDRVTSRLIVAIEDSGLLDSAGLSQTRSSPTSR